MINPTYEVRPNEDGTFKVIVTPPAFFALQPSEITLTADQYKRFQDWCASGILIQDAFPDLTPGQREILLSGIGEKDWDETFKEE